MGGIPLFERLQMQSVTECYGFDMLHEQMYTRLPLEGEQVDFHPLEGPEGGSL